LAGPAVRSRVALECCQAPYEVSPGCTSRIRKTHVTEVLEVLYPWHPWFGRQVYIHTIVERNDARIFGCATGRYITSPSPSK
jgi:hypothetical protein